MADDNLKNEIVKGVKDILAEQTVVILNAVDEKISGVRVDLVNLEIKIDKRLESMEDRWIKKLDDLTTTLDKFLKRMTDMEDEFTMMRNDLNKVKKVIKEKFGVDL